MSKAQGSPEHRRPIAVPGHPGVFKKGSRYQVRWRYRGRQAARSFRTLTEAKRFKAATVAGEGRPSSREAFKSYAQRWVESYTGRTSSGISPATRASYRDALERFAIPFFGTTKLNEIDAPLIRDFIAHLVDKDLAPGTVRRYHAPVKALLATAYEDGSIPTNPAQSVRVIVSNRRAGRKPRLTTEQTRSLLAHMPQQHADLAYFLAATGVRISEALGAVWGDLAHGGSGRPVLTIRRSKTAAGERILAMSPETNRVLLRRRAEASFARDADPIFPNEFGKPMDAHNYRRRVFAPAARAAGVPWATPHALRHGLASLMAEHGFTPSQIAAQLGHADGGVLALKTYIHSEVMDAPDFVDAALAQRHGS